MCACIYMYIYISMYMYIAEITISVLESNFADIQSSNSLNILTI